MEDNELKEVNETVKEEKPQEVDNRRYIKIGGRKQKHKDPSAQKPKKKIISVKDDGKVVKVKSPVTDKVQEDQPQEAPQVEEKPVEETPVEQPKEEAKAEEKPVEEQPAEEAQPEEAPQEEVAPEEASADEQPQEEPQAEETPVEEPAEGAESVSEEEKPEEAPTEEEPVAEEPQPVEEQPAEEQPQEESAPVEEPQEAVEQPQEEPAVEEPVQEEQQEVQSVEEKLEEVPTEEPAEEQPQDEAAAEQPEEVPSEAQSEEEKLEEAPTEEQPQEEPAPEESPVEESDEEQPAEEEKLEEQPEEVPAEEEKVEEEPEFKPQEKYTEPYPRPAARIGQPEGAAFTFYAERINESEEGQFLYSGDDGLPFVNEHILLNADGEGGASCIRHTQFDRGLFEEELVFNTLFKNIYGDKAENPLLNDYVVDSFAVLISMRHLYDGDLAKNIRRYRKSGHFGSRIASAVMLHQLLDEKLQNNIFDMFAKISKAYKKEKDKAQEIEKELVNKATEEITAKFKEEFFKAAENGKFVYESKMNGLDLLGTTLCATVVKENEKDVDAFYLLAGDSLPFVMNKNGLFEVMKAHEGPDGGMTNKIRSNDQQIIDFYRGKKEIKEFYLEGKHVKFEKPCILFNASDGVFDCNYFVSPLALEKLILEEIVEAKDYEDLSHNLRLYFEAYGTHDDSATMAAKFYGFASYDEVKEYARKRLDDIVRDYLDDTTGGMSTLLDRLYEVERNNILSKEREKSTRLYNEINKNPAVADFYKNRISRFSIEVETHRATIRKIDSLLEHINQEIEFHVANIAFRSDEHNKYEFAVRHALNDEVNLLKGLKESEEARLQRLLDGASYKTLKEEWTERGVLKTLETLVNNNLYTNDEANELLVKYDIAADNSVQEELDRLEELSNRQKGILAIYQEKYESLEKGEE